MPAGHLAIFDLDDNGMPTNCDAARIVDLTGLAETAATDPEPEFVSINSKNHAVVTLQENNHIAVVDLASGKVVADFSAGAATAENVPVKKARMSDASGSSENVLREPDAVAWIDDERSSQPMKVTTKAARVALRSGVPREMFCSNSGNRWSTWACPWSLSGQACSQEGHGAGRRRCRKIRRRDPYFRKLRTRQLCCGLQGYRRRTRIHPVAADACRSGRSLGAPEPRSLRGCQRSRQCGRQCPLAYHALQVWRCSPDLSVRSLRHGSEKGAPIGWGALSALGLPRSVRRQQALRG